MKALSLSQPWLWAVLYAGKHVENRSWPPPIDMIEQRIALHAAKSWDDDAISFFIKLGIEHPHRKDLYTAGAIVGVATIDRVVTTDKTIADDQKRWFFGEYGWLLKDVRPLKSPIPATGRQKLWTMSPEIEGAVMLQLGLATLAEAGA